MSRPSGGASPGLQARTLAPLGLIYGTITARRMAMEGAKAGLPVLCVGNFTLGGAGKTPAVIMLARMLADGGGRPFCLSRGYGGTEAGPKLVDGRSDNAAQVGDEALLLAHAAPTVVAHDRVAGAEFARAQGASVIILDDGLQNPSLAKDFTLAVIDARRGIGNARVFPAGPLRAPLDAQLCRRLSGSWRTLRTVFASSVQVGPELALVQPGADDIVVLVGPYELVGILGDWRSIIEREKADRQDGFEPDANARMERFEGERSTFAVLDTD